jgi:hypothetical protein
LRLLQVAEAADPVGRDAGQIQRRTPAGGSDQSEWRDVRAVRLGVEQSPVGREQGREVLAGFQRADEQQVPLG